MGPLPTRGPAREELSPAQRAVLDVLVDLGGRRTVGELAAHLGQHPNTVREHLEVLTGAGLVERTVRPPAGRGRPAALYGATLAATPAGPEYAVLAEVLIGYLARMVPDAAVRAEHARSAGREWGRALQRREGSAGAPPAVENDVPAQSPLQHSVNHLAAVFDRAGFDTHSEEDADGGYTQRLRRCPVLALAREHPDVVCTSHLGMAQEILGHEGISPGRVSLDAFAEPGACLLRVAPPRR